MSEVLAVLLNGIAQLEYDRNKPLSDYQQAYLDSMDSKMDAGISIDGQLIEKPDINQRVQFVTANLLNAMKSGEEGMTSALCSYIATRLPDLKQVKITDNEGEVSIEFDFENDYTNQVAVQFQLH